MLIAANFFMFALAIVAETDDCRGLGKWLTIIIIDILCIYLILKI